MRNVFGREGTHVLLNGRKQSSLLVRSGAPQRWRIVNAAKSRYFNLDLGGVVFRQIGGDGGLQDTPSSATCCCSRQASVRMSS